jgi:secreted PhoX family phosphatase
MARPEDVEVNPITKKVYAVMTGNSGAEVNAANPRPGGSSIAGQGLGHVIEIVEADDDHGAGSFTWELVLLCGDPDTPGGVAQATSPEVVNWDPNSSTWWATHWEGNVSPIARVDNAAFDSKGFLYLTTDGQPSALQRNLTGINDAIVAMPVEGNHVGFAKALVYGPRGSEMTGPYFTPDDRTLFASVQHPGVDLFTWSSPTVAPSSTVGGYAAPGSTWNTTAAVPGHTPGVPRPATFVVRRHDGREGGSGAVDAPPGGGEVATAGLPQGAAGLAAAARARVSRARAAGRSWQAAGRPRAGAGAGCGGR